MRCLFIDTSLDGVGVASVDLKAKDLKPDFIDFSLEKYGSAAKLSAMVKEAKKQVGDFAAICVSGGPGSFTGIKVGLAWVYGYLASSPPKPLVAELSAFESALAFLGEKEKAQVFLYWPLTKAHGFLGAFDPKTKEVAVSLHQGDQEACALGKIADLKSQGLWFAAGDWPLFSKSHPDLSVRTLEGREMLEYSLYGMIEKAARDLSIFGQSLPEPKYLRKTTAEENYDKIHKERQSE